MVQHFSERVIDGVLDDVIAASLDCVNCASENDWDVFFQGNHIFESTTHRS